MKNNILIWGVILLFLLSSLIPIASSYSSYETNKVYTIHMDENGTLSGYVKDTSMNPIEGAKVRVYFHGTYEENYTDSSGHYNVTNIPICWCLKNTTASKEGYTIKWVLLAIGENTTYDFILTPFPLDTIYVDDDNTQGPWDGTEYHPYQYIQDAIDNAYDDDTVFVYNGTYYENVVVDKSIDLIGENRDITVIDGMRSDDALRIKSSSVNFSEFTVMNSSIDGWSSGIGVIEKNWWNESDPPDILSNITIYNCIIIASEVGIRLDYTNNVNIMNCTINNNSGCSVYIFNSSKLVVKGCHIFNNGEEIDSNSCYPGGIVIDGADIDRNGCCSDITITNCSIHDNICAGVLVLPKCTNIEIICNRISNNSMYGISIHESTVNVYENIIFRNGDNKYWNGGIYLQDCMHTVTINNNNIASNNPNGIYLLRSSDNTIIKNDFINNTCNAFFKIRSPFFNHWNRNYWDDWCGFGPKLIKGQIGKLLIPWVNFDWHPAKEPYDISL